MISSIFNKWSYTLIYDFKTILKIVSCVKKLYLLWKGLHNTAKIGVVLLQGTFPAFGWRTQHRDLSRVSPRGHYPRIMKTLDGRKRSLKEAMQFGAIFMVSVAFLNGVVGTMIGKKLVG